MTFELETIKALLGIDLEDKSQDTNVCNGECEKHYP